MNTTRFEDYTHINSQSAFTVNANLKRTKTALNAVPNWHENLELQFCKSGNGFLLLDGKRMPFCEGDIAVINSNTIHFTGTEGDIVYTAVIISCDFLIKMGINYKRLSFIPIIKSEKITDLYNQIETMRNDNSVKFKAARENTLLMEIMIELCENFSVFTDELQSSRAYERIKAAIKFIREHYGEKLTLEKISKSIYVDKYFLSHEFKKHTGNTVIEYINSYRCQMAAGFIKQGLNVSEAASKCGFENLSFFSKTFKKYMGVLPSELK